MPGIRLATASSRTRYQNRDDLLLMEFAEGTQAACLLTQNRARAAPVEVAARHLAESTSPRYLLANAGNANAGLGQVGVRDSEKCCTLLADLAKVPAHRVLPFSTGVIGERLPLEKILRQLPALHASLADDRWHEASRAIMTTDTVAKIVSRRIAIAGKHIHLCAIVKGAGMIQPNMATMLCFAGCDAKIESTRLHALLTDACRHSFHAITVDGDTSTNDACFIAATGQSGVALTAENEMIFAQTLHEGLVELAQDIVKDAEGATRFATILVRQAADEETARCVAMTVANSPLVKTSLYAGDPNWGRILAAVGRSASTVNPELLSIRIGKHCVFQNGAIAPGYDEKQAAQEMAGREITVCIDLGQGDAEFQAWTSDLSPEYVAINADYRS